MPEESTISNQSLLRRTLVMVGVMVGACVLVVGTLTLVASSVVGHMVGASEEAADGGGAVAVPTPAGPSRPVPARLKAGIDAANKKK